MPEKEYTMNETSKFAILSATKIDLFFYDYFIIFLFILLLWPTLDPTMRLLDKKIQKVMNLQTTKPEVIEALDSFSEFFISSDNAIDARKGMRLTLEGIGIDISKQFSSELQGFFQVFLFLTFILIHPSRCWIRSPIRWRKSMKPAMRLTSDWILYGVTFRPSTNTLMRLKRTSI